MRLTKRRPMLVADLFCGAGGSSTGARKALAAQGIEMELVAVNHWPIAIETHQKNHPDARHYCVDLDAARPVDLVPEGQLDLLMASPECTHHSRARGGKPIHDQSRMSAWHVLRWATDLYIRRILIENVPEFREWAPLGANGRPLKSRRGQVYQDFLAALRGLGYVVEDRIVNAADYGDATTRSRLFIMARRDRKRLIWPVPTHSREAQVDMFGNATERWRSAREIIDWSIHGTSIFDRKRPLAPNTIRRIAAGLRKFGGPMAEPFLVVLRNNMDAQSVDGPLPAITASGTHMALAQMELEPFVLGQQSGSVARHTGDPLPTVSTDGAIGLVESELTPYERPFITEYYGNGGAQSAEDPLPTVTTRDRFALVEPYMVQIDQSGGGSGARSIERPIGTLVTKQNVALVQPYLVPQFGEREGQEPRTHAITGPLPAITSHGAGALVQPVVERVGDLITGGRLIKINGVLYRLDIRFRMLRNLELARAMGFSDDETTYEFVGTGEQVTKQIGNAVPVNTASALVGALMIQ